MVTISNYQLRKTEEGKEFFVLEIQGDLKMVESKSTGKFYASVKKATMPCTFDENTCQAMIGKQIEGSIEKVPCEPYEYANPDTGEVVELSHRYEYSPIELDSVEDEKSITVNQLISEGVDAL